MYKQHYSGYSPCPLLQNLCERQFQFLRALRFNEVFKSTDRGKARFWREDECISNVKLGDTVFLTDLVDVLGELVT
jgi:hypothetical protein